MQSSSASGQVGCQSPDAALRQGAAFVDAPNELAWWMTLAAITAILAVPLFLVSMPPLLDYPNHLARVWAITAGQRIPAVAHMFAPAWGIKPYLAFDVIASVLLQFLPVYVAGKVTLAITLFLQLAGVVVYCRALFGRRSYWPFASCLLGYGTIFLFGFTDFLLGMSLAFLAAGLWIAKRESRPLATSVASAVLALLCLLVHPIDLAILLALIGSYELDWLWRRWSARTLRVSAFGYRVLIAIAVFALPFLGALHFTGEFGQGQVTYQPVRQILSRMPFAFYSYDRWSDLALAIAVVGFMVWAYWRGFLRVPRITLIQLAVLGIAYLAVPWYWGLGGIISIRFVYAGCFLLFCGTLPKDLPRRLGVVVCVCLAAIFLIRMTTVGEIWHSHNRVLASFRQVIAPVAPGSKVLVVMGPHTSRHDLAQMPASCRVAARQQICQSLPALLLIEKHAFWDALFAKPQGQFPIKALPPYDALLSLVAYQPDWDVLTSDHRTPRQAWLSPNLPGWQHKYDYVLLMYPKLVPDTEHWLPGTLKLVRKGGVAALYRIIKPPSAP